MNCFELLSEAKLHFHSVDEGVTGKFICEYTSPSSCKINNSMVAWNSLNNNATLFIGRMRFFIRVNNWGTFLPVGVPSRNIIEKVTGALSNTTVTSCWQCRCLPRSIRNMALLHFKCVRKYYGSSLHCWSLPQSFGTPLSFIDVTVNSSLSHTKWQQYYEPSYLKRARPRRQYRQCF